MVKLMDIRVFFLPEDDDDDMIRVRCLEELCVRLTTARPCCLPLHVGQGAKPEGRNGRGTCGGALTLNSVQKA